MLIHWFLIDSKPLSLNRYFSDKMHNRSWFRMPSRLFKGLGRGGREGEWDGGAEEAGGGEGGGVTTH